KVVGRVPERDHLRAQPASNLIHGPAAEPAAHVAPMIRLLVEQPNRGIVAMAGPIDSARLEILSDRLNGTQKLALLDRKCANREVYGRPVAKPDQRLQQREGVLAAGERHRDAISVADHLEARNGLAYLAQQCFFEVQAFIIRTRSPTTRKRAARRTQAQSPTFGTRAPRGSGGDRRAASS